MSNAGPKQAAWPASEQRYAIGIHPYSLERNQISSFTADDVPNSNNLIVPGEVVMTYTLRGPNFEIADGTSYAAPIAPAMATLILAYVDENRCEKEEKKAKALVDIWNLSRTVEMTNLLRSLRSAPRNGCRYTLIPMTLFWETSSKAKSDEEDKRIAWDIIKQLLKNQYVSCTRESWDGTESSRARLAHML
ncbi:hypothetical protein B0J12DRAFT_259848 [Macrophomina phaseolina]|uniref:Peptidase S8/S53 domain-containing protein n=1 Tax=Macrophomina phaseolina TaxID=35725 RepID=A0ABQ8FYX8_9PEZI|nr:hypothetical protein B0J12DRAFT_259848 [Macrophomina phaseolina]